jgi:hypothetical protein
MPPSPTDNPSVITIENANGCIPSVMFSRELFFCRASSSIRPLMFRRWLVFLFPTESATEWEIADDQHSDGRILLVRSSVIMLPMDFMPYTDGINLSEKLFNGVMNIYLHFPILFFTKALLW